MSSLGYTNQKTMVALGSINDGVRTGSTLSTTGSDNRYEFPSGGYSKVDVALLYNMDAAETGNSIELIFEQSPDGENWYRIPNETVTDGTSTLNERTFVFTGNDEASKEISIGIDVWYKNLRFSVVETGVVTNFGDVFAHLTVSE